MTLLKFGGFNSAQGCPSGIPWVAIQLSATTTCLRSKASEA